MLNDPSTVEPQLTETSIHRTHPGNGEAPGDPKKTSQPRL